MPSSDDHPTLRHRRNSGSDSKTAMAEELEVAPFLPPNGDVDDGEDDLADGYSLLPLRQRHFCGPALPHRRRARCITGVRLAVVETLLRRSDLRRRTSDRMEGRQDARD